MADFWLLGAPHQVQPGTLSGPLSGRSFPGLGQMPMPQMQGPCQHSQASKGCFTLAALAPQHAAHFYSPADNWINCPLHCLIRHCTSTCRISSTCKTCSRSTCSRCHITCKPLQLCVKLPKSLRSCSSRYRSRSNAWSRWPTSFRSRACRNPPAFGPSSPLRSAQINNHMPRSRLNHVRPSQTQPQSWTC